jgi:hypothetical protein
MRARHELKHSINYGDYILLRDRLRHVMQRDAHADANGEYRVRSLYFDTLTDKALLEKINGVDDRVKYRLRRYIGVPGFIKLEKKSKRNGLGTKESAQLTEAEVRQILAGDIAWMKADARPLVAQLYEKMAIEGFQPKTIVDYIREPFTCAAGNVRVTLDRDIRTGLFATDFLNDDLPTVKAGDEMIVLEVKYDQFIPQHLVGLLQLDSRRATACSKYALCRIYG